MGPVQRLHSISWTPQRPWVYAVGDLRIGRTCLDFVQDQLATESRCPVVSILGDVTYDCLRGAGRFALELVDREEVDLRFGPTLEIGASDSDGAMIAASIEATAEISKQERERMETALNWGGPENGFGSFIRKTRHKREHAGRQITSKLQTILTPI